MGRPLGPGKFSSTAMDISLSSERWGWGINRSGLSNNRLWCLTRMYAAQAYRKTCVCSNGDVETRAKSGRLYGRFAIVFFVAEGKSTTPLWWLGQIQVTLKATWISLLRGEHAWIEDCHRMRRQKKSLRRAEALAPNWLFGYLLGLR